MEVSMEKQRAVKLAKRSGSRYNCYQSDSHGRLDPLRAVPE
jgi:hypothetical protein